MPVILNRKFTLVGADNQTAESRIRGLTLAGSYVDELSIIGGPNGEPWFNPICLPAIRCRAESVRDNEPGPP